MWIIAGIANAVADGGATKNWCTLEPLADGVAGDVDDVALLEEVGEVERLAGLEGVDGGEPELLQVLQRRGAGLAQVSQLRAGELLLAHAVVPDLNGVVPVRGRRLHLRHHVAALPEPDDRHGHRLPRLRVEVGHHPHLGRHHAHPGLVRRAHRHGRPPPPPDAGRRAAPGDDGAASAALREERGHCAADAHGRHGHACFGRD